MTERICRFVGALCVRVWDLVAAAHVVQPGVAMRTLVYRDLVERLLERQHRHQLAYLFRPP